jgi:hypothetical protein
MLDLNGGRIGGLNWGLSSKLQAIKSGKITNWREVGGQDLPIHIYASGAEELNDAIFSQIVNSTDAFRKVASDPGGIHFGSSGTLTVAQCGVKTLSIGTSSDRLVALTSFRRSLPPIVRHRNTINSIPMCCNRGLIPYCGSFRSRSLKMVARANKQVKPMPIYCLPLRVKS